MDRKYSAATLRRRLERLEESLRNEKLRLHRQIENTGWGTGMRCTKCSPSFRREEDLEAKIAAVKVQLREAEAAS